MRGEGGLQEGGSEAPRTHSLLLQNAETVRLVTAGRVGVPPRNSLVSGPPSSFTGQPIRWVAGLTST